MAGSGREGAVTKSNIVVRTPLQTGCGCSLSIAHTKHDLANGYHHLILSESERIRLVVTILKHPKIGTARTEEKLLGL